MKEEFNFYSPMSLKSYNLDETMRYQLNMLDTLDVFTRKHCENVANITCRLCELLHLNKGFIIYATICAYLHDIGKMFIPQEILQKPGKLTKKEYEIMKTHTTLGYDMCMKDLKLRPYAAGALYHHEALNGTGYPQGLKGIKIPLVGQIIRVADEYDAIVSKRQYKSHIGISETLKIIIENTYPVSSLEEIVENAKLGKNNKKIVSKLIKIVIADTEYEISGIFDYADKLKAEVDRLKQANEYYEEMLKQKQEKKKTYYEEGVKMFLKNTETVDNFREFLSNYEDAYNLQKEKIDTLYNEIKNIKKLKV